MSEVELTRADAGKSVSLQPGDVLTIRLPETPTSGFRWGVDSADPSILEPLDTDWRESPDSGGLGSGGERTLRFRVKRSGATQLKLKHWREWEGDRSVVDRFDVTVSA